jgi:HSP20 family protein
MHPLFLFVMWRVLIWINLRAQTDTKKFCSNDCNCFDLNQHESHAQLLHSPSQLYCFDFCCWRFFLKGIVMSSHLSLFQPAWGTSLDPLLGRFFSPIDFAPLVDQPANIRIEVKEDDKQFEVQAEIPGVKKEDIKVQVDGNRLQIDAQINRNAEEKDKAGKVIRSERYYGAVSRALSLSHDIDAGQSQAKYDDGVLKLTLPKRGDVKPGHLKIQ